MKKIQTLLALAALTSTTVFAAVEIDFEDGAEMAGNITGNAKFDGTGSMILSGVVSGDSELAAGNVKIASASKFGGNVNMNGGGLEATAAMTIPSLIMTQAATVTADAAVTVQTDSGSGAVTLAGAGDATLGAMSSTGGIASAVPLVKVNAGSVLHAASYNVDALEIDADAAAPGNFATFAANSVDATACNVAAGSFTSLTTSTLNIGGKKFSQAVTAAAGV